MKRFTTSLLLLLLVNMAWAAQVENVQSKQQGTNIEISYQLVDANPLQQFEVFVFCSIDGKEIAQSLKEVTGAVGKTVIGGGTKAILWNPIKEFGQLHGKVVFKIIANPIQLLRTTTGRLDGMKVTAQNCFQHGKFVTVDLIFKNPKDAKRFDLHTNYIKAVDNKGNELYAINYIKGTDKVTTKRPISIKKGGELKLTVTFEATSISLLTSLELETKFPNNFMIIKNIPVNK